MAPISSLHQVDAFLLNAGLVLEGKVGTMAGSAHPPSQGYPSNFRAWLGTPGVPFQEDGGVENKNANYLPPCGVVH